MRCSGHCCESMTINMEMHEIKVYAEEWEEGCDDQFFYDAYMIYNMLEPIEYDPTKGEYFRLHTNRQTYRCKHHDKESGDCMVYDKRPLMCKDHPTYGTIDRRCMYKGCTHKDRASIEQILEQGKVYAIKELDGLKCDNEHHALNKWQGWKNPQINITKGFVQYYSYIERHHRKLARLYKKDPEKAALIEIELLRDRPVELG